MLEFATRRLEPLLGMCEDFAARWLSRLWFRPPGDFSLFSVCDDFAAMGLSHGGRFARERRGDARKGRSSIDSALPSRPEGTSGVLEQTDASGGSELRDQLATLVGVMMQQADVVQHQQEVVVCQEEQIKRLQETVDQLVTAPAAARRGWPGVTAEMFPSGSGDPTPASSEDADPWIVEMWIDSMETLFEDLYTLERDKDIPSRALFETVGEGVVERRQAGSIA
uniref:Uncharacterized protein n=1 Tax=Ananas comosus var. bracteatus TaxID=296719 RepID=A0A6V7NXF8_ANACO|nr:unnamed protein product [Ananas comosus var. bracteatus]